MTRDYQRQKQNFLIMVIACIGLIGACLFSFFVLQKRKSIETEKRKIELANENLRQQLVILSKTNTINNSPESFNTAQIFNLVAENADQYQIRIKGFTPTTDTNNLLINLIGTYPKAIRFFEGLYQHKLSSIRKIELKKYDQEPNASVEIIVTLTTSPEGGKQK